MSLGLENLCYTFPAKIPSFFLTAVAVVLSLLVFDTTTVGPCQHLNKFDSWSNPATTQLRLFSAYSTGRFCNVIITVLPGS
jgi:hypothetical protein